MVFYKFSETQWLSIKERSYARLILLRYVIIYRSTLFGISFWELSIFSL